jgi:hypothetical protein
MATLAGRWMLTADMSRFDPKPTSFDLDQQTALAMVRSGVVPASDARAHVGQNVI